MPLVIENKLRAVTVADEFEYNRKYIFFISLVASLGGLLFGYDLANVSGAIDFFSKHFQLDQLSVGWAVGCISVGAAAGALIAGKLSDMIGRKKLLIISATLFAITGVGTGWAGSFLVFIIFRIFSGIAVGFATVVCPIYIAEMSPAIFRGRLVAYYQLAITFGVLLAYVSNYLLLHSGINNWRWMFSSQSIPAILFFTGLLFVLESPRWLIMKGRDSEARQVMERIGGSRFANDEFSAIQSNSSHPLKESIGNLFKKNVLHIVIAGIGIAMFSQLGGPLVAYAPEIFKAAGMAQSSAFFQSIAIGIVLFLFTIVAIATVDKVGRRTLLLWGISLLLFFTLALSLAFHFHISGFWILIFSLGYLAVYAATVGAVSWVVLSEIFPNHIRGTAMSLATLSLWVANFLITASFPVLRENFGMSMSFGIYVPLFFVFFLFVYFRIPETKGKSLEEIERLLVRPT